MNSPVSSSLRPLNNKTTGAIVQSKSQSEVIHNTSEKTNCSQLCVLFYPRFQPFPVGICITWLSQSAEMNPLMFERFGTIAFVKFSVKLSNLFQKTRLAPVVDGSIGNDENDDNAMVDVYL